MPIRLGEFGLNSDLATISKRQMKVEVWRARPDWIVPALVLETQLLDRLGKTESFREFILWRLTPGIEEVDSKGRGGKQSAHLCRPAGYVLQFRAIALAELGSLVRLT